MKETKNTNQTSSGKNNPDKTNQPSQSGSSTKKSQSQRKKKKPSNNQNKNQAGNNSNINPLDSVKKELLETQNNLSDLLVKYRQLNDANNRNEPQLIHLKSTVNQLQKTIDQKQNKYQHSINDCNNYIKDLENQSLKQHINMWLSRSNFFVKLFFILILFGYSILAYAGLHFYKVAVDNDLLNYFPNLIWSIGFLGFFAFSVTMSVVLLIPPINKITKR